MASLKFWIRKAVENTDRTSQRTLLRWRDLEETMPKYKDLCAFRLFWEIFESKEPLKVPKEESKVFM